MPHDPSTTTVPRPALTASLVPEALPRVPRTGGGQKAARLIDRAALRAAYEAGASTTDLARRHGVSNKTVSTLLKAAGARLRSVAEARKVRATNAWLHLPKPEPVEGRPEVADVFGVVHRVVSLSPTELGFDILRGYPVAQPGGAPAVILTVPLVADLARHRLQPGRSTLPLSAATLTRLRRKLDLDWRAETRAWWEAHADELVRAETRTEAFAAQHGAGPAMVNRVRRRLVGKRRQPRSAWLDEAAKALILAAEKPREEIGRALGIAPATVSDLRAELRQEAGLPPASARWTVRRVPRKVGGAKGRTVYLLCRVVGPASEGDEALTVLGVYATPARAKGALARARVSGREDGLQVRAIVLDEDRWPEEPTGPSAAARRDRPARGGATRS